MSWACAGTRSIHQYRVHVEGSTHTADLFLQLWGDLGSRRQNEVRVERSEDLGEWLHQAAVVAEWDDR